MAERKKRFSGLYWQQFALTAGMVMLTLLLLGISFFTLSYGTTTADKRGEMRTRAELIAQVSADYFTAAGDTGIDQAAALRKLADMASRMTDVDFLICSTQGNVLLTTGAKELAAFAALSPERLFPRVLPTREGIAACEAASIPHKNIIAMQGPFSYALNCALIKQFSIRYLVTKDGGAVGGFAEKAQAAQDTGAQLIVVRRPAENGQTAAQILARCKEVLI